MIASAEVPNDRAVKRQSYMRDLRMGSSTMIKHCAKNFNIDIEGKTYSQVIEEIGLHEYPDLDEVIE